MFIKLIKLALYEAFERGSGRRKTRAFWGRLSLVMKMVVSTLIAAAFFYLGFNAILSPMAQAFIKTSQTSVYWGFTALLAFLFTVFLTIYYAGPILYAAKDNERLLTMPIRPIHIVIARLAAIYILGLQIVIAIMVAAVVVYLKYASLTPSQGLLLALYGLLIPSLAVVISVLIGYVVNWVQKKVRRGRNIIGLIVGLLAFALYMYAAMSLQSGIAHFVQRGASFHDALSRYAPFLYSGAEAVAQGSWAKIAWQALISLVPLAIIAAFTSRFYLSSVRMTAASGGVAFKGIRGQRRGVRRALVTREMKRYMSQTTVLLNTVIGPIMTIALGVYLLIFAPGGALQSDPDFIAVKPYGVLAGLGVSAFIMSNLLLTASSLSIEGTAFNQLKTLPLSVRTLLSGKIIVQLIVGVPPVIVLAFGVWRFAGLSLVDLLIMVWGGIALAALGAYLGLVVNLRWARFDYANMIIAVKRSMSVGVTLIAEWSYIVLLAALYIFVLRSVLSPQLYAIAVAAFTTVLVGLCMVYLGQRGQKRFNKLVA